MIINFIRSSSFSQWDFCQQQYYLTYVLGLPRGSSKKALQGTIVHKVMEILANCKKIMQDTNDSNTTFSFDDEHIGQVTWTTKEFLEPYELSNEEIVAINKKRINKYKYKHDAKIPYGTIHYGKDMVDGLFERVFEYYAQDDWLPVDKKDCYNWTWMGLEYQNGAFDPRKSKIVAAEPHFDFVIEEPWAYYEWELKGEKISGYLGIKGTIDLIVDVGDGIIEVRDYKCGQRIDWACKTKNNKKTYEKLCNDFQLMLYYYAVKQMYPEVNQVITTIFYIRDGGPFTINIDDGKIQEVKDRIRERFTTISNCNLPMMQDASQRDFRCTKICDFYKMVAPNGQNMCKFIHDKIIDIGIDEVTNKYTQKGFSVGQYQAPGEK